MGTARGERVWRKENNIAPDGIVDRAPRALPPLSLSPSLMKMKISPPEERMEEKEEEIGAGPSLALRHCVRLRKTFKLSPLLWEQEYS